MSVNEQVITPRPIPIQRARIKITLPPDYFKTNQLGAKLRHLAGTVERLENEGYHVSLDFKKRGPDFVEIEIPNETLQKMREKHRRKLGLI